jgi:hypothetical protein
VIAPYDRGDWQARLGPLLAEWLDEIVPRAVQPPPHSTYSPVYAWMYAYEKALRRRLERTLGRPLGVWERRLFGPDGAFSEGLSNAFLHGHRRDPSLAIQIACRVAHQGLDLSIHDQGPGFDFEASRAARLRGGAYFNVAGNGLRCFESDPDIVAAYADGGRTLHLLVPCGARPMPAPALSSGRAGE